MSCKPSSCSPSWAVTPTPGPAKPALLWVLPAANETSAAPGCAQGMALALVLPPWAAGWESWSNLSVWRMRRNELCLGSLILSRNPHLPRSVSGIVVSPQSSPCWPLSCLCGLGEAGAACEGWGAGSRWLPGQIPAALWRAELCICFILVDSFQIVCQYFQYFSCSPFSFLSLFPFLHHFLLTPQDYALHEKCCGRTPRHFCFELFPIHQLEKL